MITYGGHKPSEKQIYFLQHFGISMRRECIEITTTRGLKNYSRQFLLFNRMCAHILRNENH